MDILIKNMEMPSEGRIINLTICSDGSVINNLPDAGGKMSSYHSERVKAVALPSHGDLIERQDVLSYFETAFLMGADMDYEDIMGIVSNPKAIPTIVEASNGTDN